MSESNKGKKSAPQGGKGGKGGKPQQEEKKPEAPVQEKKQPEKKEEVKVAPVEEVKKEEKIPTPTFTKKEGPSSSPAAPGEKKERKDNKPPVEREKGKGMVKAVLSGDTIVVINLSKNQGGPPQEKIISLSNLNAPSLGRKKNEDKEATQDKPWAWQSREFLRQKLIGKQVTYVIENKAPKKEYGVVFLDNENVAKDILANGWAKLRRPNNDRALWPELEELSSLEKAAESSGKGLWNKNAEESKASIRPLINTDVVPTEAFGKLKGAPQTGIVEQVKGGNSFRVTLLPSFWEINLILSGVDCPSARPNNPERFGREAKFFSEHHVLGREVTIIFEAADKHNFYGTVSVYGRYISEELLKEGLGKYVDWSGSRTGLADRLKEAENIAKEKKLRLWTDFVSTKPLTREEGGKKVAKPGKEITGKVIEVANAGCIVILDSSKTEHKIYLSSIKVPRQGAPVPPKDESKEDALERFLAFEAKEFLRKRIIGAKVRCVMDYMREATNPRNKDKVEERNYCSIYLDKNNVAVELVEQGFATAQEHRGGEQRSRDYEHILFAESRAKKMGKGQHAAKDKVAISHVQDISGGNAQDVKAAKQKFPFFQRAGRMRGVIEYEFSASRFKVLVPKESCQIMLSLGAVQTPQRDSPLFKPALLFVKERVHQHDVEFDVVGQDTKGSGFIGNVWLGKQSLHCMLLEEGFAKIYRGADKDSEMIIAEDIAKRAKKNLWHDYDEAAEEARRKERRAEESERRRPKQEYIDVVVTEIIDGTTFYVQIVGSEAEKLEELMKSLAVEESADAYKPRRDEVVKAQFSDDAWYRAKVIKVVGDDEYQVQYVDYGNSEVIPSSRIRKLPNEFNPTLKESKALPFQAVRAVLAYLKTPPVEDEYGREAAEFLKELVWGKTMMANIERRDPEVLHLSLGDRESQVHVNAALLRAGLARVDKVRGEQYREMLDKLREEESKARSTHAGIWEYGDPGSDEDDEDNRPKGKKRN